MHTWGGFSPLLKENKTKHTGVFGEDPCSLSTKTTCKKLQAYAAFSSILIKSREIYVRKMGLFLEKTFRKQFPKTHFHTSSSGCHLENQNKKGYLNHNRTPLKIFKTFISFLSCLSFLSNQTEHSAIRVHSVFQITKFKSKS